MKNKIVVFINQNINDALNPITIRNAKLLAGYAYGSETDFVIQVSSEDEQTAFNIRFYPNEKRVTSDILIDGEWAGRKNVAAWE